MQKERGLKEDDLSFINSTTDEFKDQILIGEISHEYDIFEAIDGQHEFEWKMTEIKKSSFCFQLLFDNPLIISYYGVDNMMFEFDVEGKIGVSLQDLFKFTPIISRDMEISGPSGKLKEDGTVLMEIELS